MRKHRDWCRPGSIVRHISNACRDLGPLWNSDTDVEFPLCCCSSWQYASASLPFCLCIFLFSSALLLHISYSLSFILHYLRATTFSSLSRTCDCILIPPNFPREPQPRVYLSQTTGPYSPCPIKGMSIQQSFAATRWFTHSALLSNTSKRLYYYIFFMMKDKIGAHLMTTHSTFYSFSSSRVKSACIMF